MNQRTVLGITLLFVVITFTQCTVQKRLYRKGYYISFHKTPKSSGETKEEKQLADFPVTDTIQTADVEVSEPLESVAELPVTTSESSNQSEQEQVVSWSVKSLLEQAKETPPSLVKQVLSYSKKDLEPEPVERKQLRDTQIIIVVGMILLFAIGIGLVFLAIATGNPVPAVIGVVISLASLVGLFIGLAVEDSIANDGKRTSEKKVQKEKEQKLSEEEWWELKEKQYRKAVRTTILLVVLFFGISLFAVAIGEPMPLIAITGAMFLIFLAFVWSTYKQKRKDDPVTETES